VSARTGIRGQDRFVVQAPADATRIATGTSPYREPVADHPSGRQAFSTSFRLEPPALLLPDRPPMPPGASTLLVPLRLLGYDDPRWLTLLALTALAVAVLSSRLAPLGPERSALFFLAPVALGAVFGSPHALSAAVVFAAGCAARREHPVLAGSLAALAAAIDPITIPAVPFLVATLAPERGARRRAWLAVASAFGLLVLPVFVLDPAAFLASLGRGPEPGPGLGIANLALYAGFASYGAAMALLVAGLIALGMAKLIARGSALASPLALASLATLLVLVVVPGVSADAIAIPLALGLVAVLPLRTPDGSAARP
jgi:hypothetical protein